MAGAVGYRENWGMGAVAVVAVVGIGAGFGAWWRQAGPEGSHRGNKPRGNTLAVVVVAAAVGIAGDQQADLEHFEDIACAEQEGH